jgi:hypothetical protein
VGPACAVAAPIACSRHPALRRYSATIIRRGNRQITRWLVETSPRKGLREGWGSRGRSSPGGRPPFVFSTRTVWRTAGRSVTGPQRARSRGRGAGLSWRRPAVVQLVLNCGVCRSGSKRRGDGTTCSQGRHCAPVDVSTKPRHSRSISRRSTPLLSAGWSTPSASTRRHCPGWQDCLMMP